MAFRSDLEAAHARQRALEDKVADLQAENAELRGEALPDPDPVDAPGKRFRTQLTLAMISIGLVLGAGAATAVLLDQPEVGVLFGVSTFFALLGGYFVLLSIVEIVPPGFVLVLSGRQRQVPGGGQVGYRIAHPGRVVRIPVLESSRLLDCRLRSIEARISNAYCKGNKPLNVEFRAHIKIADTEPHINNAIERFLGRAVSEVDQVARETLEGHARGIVAELTEHEIRQDRVRFAAELLSQSDSDMSKLGIEVDTLTVESVSAAGE